MMILNTVFEEKPLMVQGVNLTDDKQKSSGSGKSAIPTMIEFCWTGDNSRSVRDIELIRFGCKEAFLESFTSCDVRKEVLRIKWNIKAKGSNTLEIHTQKYGIEKWQPASFSTVADGKKLILNWLAISKEDLFNYFIINKTKFKSFFNSSNKEKVELINRFSDASLIDSIEEIDTTKLDSDYAIKQSDISKVDGKLDLLNSNLEKELNRDFETEFEADKIDLENGIEYDEHQIERCKREISAFKGSIEVCNTNIPKLKLESLEYTKAAEKYELQIKGKRENLKEVLNELQKVQNDVDNFVAKNFELEKQGFGNDIKGIELNISELEKESIEKEDSKNKVLKAIAKIDILLSGSIECPKCKHNFIQDSEKSVEQLNTMKKGAEKLGEKYVKEKGGIESEISRIILCLEAPKKGIKELDKKEQQEIENKNELLHAVNKVSEKLNAKNAEIKAIQNSLDEELDSIKDVDSDLRDEDRIIKENESLTKQNEGEIKSYNSSISANKKLIKGLEKGGNEKEIALIKSDIKKLLLENIDQKKGLQEIEDEIFNLNQWKGNFKQFKMHVANKSIEIMEHHTNRYLIGIGSDLRVRYENQKQLANGDVKDGITTKVVRDIERTFSSFSGGEQAIMLMASILCNRYMINNSNKFGGLDFLIIDEILEGADSLVLQSLVDELKKLQTTIMIISHVSDESVSSDTLKIVKRSGLSRIEI